MHSITQFYSRAATNHACRRTKESFDLVSVKWMQAQRGELKQQQSSSMSKMVLEFEVSKEKILFGLSLQILGRLFYSRAATNHACRKMKESFDLVSVKWMQAQSGELKQQQSSSIPKMVLEFQVPKEKSSWVITTIFRKVILFSSGNKLCL